MRNIVKLQNKQVDEKVDLYFYIAGWVLIASFIVLLIAAKTAFTDGSWKFPACILHETTGYYCFGCGGTRALQALFQGQFLLSLYYHPFVPYAAVTGGWYMISRTIQYLSKGKIRIGMHFRPIWVIIALLLVLANFLLKNSILFFTGIAVM